MLKEISSNMFMIYERYWFTQSVVLRRSVDQITFVLVLTCRTDLLTDGIPFKHSSFLSLPCLCNR